MTRHGSIDDRERFLRSGSFRFLNPAEIALAPCSEIFGRIQGKMCIMHRHAEKIGDGYNLTFTLFDPATLHYTTPTHGRCQLLTIVSGSQHLKVRRC